MASPCSNSSAQPRQPWWQRVAMGAIIALLGGCAHYQENQPKTVATDEGYYFHNQERTGNSDEILLCLAFSGGGTRASAFSYGVLEALRDSTYDASAQERRMLDEVDIISSVSGGSVTAAAYALYGDQTFEILEPAFLKRNVEGALLGSVLNPINWPKIWSSSYSRSDQSAEYYDKILFKGATFSDLKGKNTPFLIINGTEIASGARISFNQHIFDILSSDIESFPLSRAVTASSAVPLVLAPITLNNYSSEHPLSPPEWLARKYPLEAGPICPHASALRRFLDSEKYPYLHISDGGVADNLGLRSYMDALSVAENNPGALESDHLKRVKKVIFISVNAAVDHQSDWNQKSKPPGSLATAGAADSRTMERYTEDTMLWFQQILREFPKRHGLNKTVDFYAIELDFSQLKGTENKLHFLSLPTSFHLPDETVDELKEAAHVLLYNNEEFKRLMKDLGSTAPAIESELTL